METRCLDSSYVGEFRKDTIGRRGTSGLCIFGSPYRRGIFPAELRRRSYKGPVIAPARDRDRSRAFSFHSKAGVGSLVRVLYVLVSAKRALIFPSYTVQSITTVAFPLSAGMITMSSACLRLLMAFCSAGQRLEAGGLALTRQPVILVRASCASEEGTLLRPPSTAAMMSGTGIFLGAGAKFRPLANTPSSALDRGLADRFTTHLSL